MMSIRWRCCGRRVENVRGRATVPVISLDGVIGVLLYGIFAAGAGLVGERCYAVTIAIAEAVNDEE